MLKGNCQLTEESSSSGGLGPVLGVGETLFSTAWTHTQETDSVSVVVNAPRIPRLKLYVGAHPVQASAVTD